MVASSQRFWLRVVLALILILLLGVVVIATLPYDLASGVVNLLAKDGSVEGFTEQSFTQIRPLLLTGLGILVLGFLAAYIWSDHSLKLVGQTWRAFRYEARVFSAGWQMLFVDFGRCFAREMIIRLILLVVLGAALRLPLLFQPMQHDESYSSVIFAFEPLFKGLSDYHFPNNHVFHTFWVHMAYRIFGAQEWAVRLPALLAGLLLIPAGFGLARHWYGKRIAWLAAFMLAALPELIDYSVNARGYTIMALLTVLMFWSASYAKRRGNTAAWFLTGVFGALGFYTLPIMVYPIAILYVWLGFSWLARDFAAQWTAGRFLGWIIGSGLLATGLGLALYIPIFRDWGFAGVFANPYTVPLAAGTFRETLFSRLEDSWNMLNQGGLPGIGFVLLGGLLLSFAAAKKTGRERVPLPFISLIVIAALVAIQRPNIYARTWIFYLPLLCIWAAAGWVRLAELLAAGKHHSKAGWSVVSLFAVGFLINGVSHVAELAPAARRGSGDVERATVLIKERLAADDIVVITADDDAIMWFYFAKYRLGRDYFSRTRPFQTAYVVVTTTNEQTVESVIAERGPDIGFFDLETAEGIAEINRLDIYRIQADRDALEKAYEEAE